jgi:ureidoglycolate dehydrogenase (NAD+)
MALVSSKRVSTDDLTEFCVEVFKRVGMSPADARTVATGLVTTDTWGTFSHGTSLLPHYVTSLRAGGIDARAQPEVVEEGPAWAILDGHAAMGMVSGCRAMDLAISKARSATISWVGVRNSNHFGAAGYYAVQATQHDMIGIALSNVDPNMAVPGARGRVIGNNPLAYAVPHEADFPVFLDIATSAIAASKIMTLKSLGQDLPGDYLADSEGLPTNKVGTWPVGSSLLPMAGHKGYGIAFVIEVLTSVLAGAGVLSASKSWILSPPEHGNLGHCFLAFNIGNVLPIELFKQRMREVSREIREAPKARGSDRIYLPGEIECEKRAAALRHGIEFPEWVKASLRGVARDFQIAPCPGLE